MRNVQIRADFREQPRAFSWYGALAPEPLDRWIEERGVLIPLDLRDLWLTFGGGVLFETEEILQPFGEPAYGENFDETNRIHRERGLPEAFFVFHEGAWVSAVRRIAPHYVTVDPDRYFVTGEFDSLERWYERTLRLEYASRYGLGSLAR